MGENHFAALPVAVYAFDLLMCAVAYILTIPSALLGYPYEAEALRITIALNWFMPDRRIEKE